LATEVRTFFRHCPACGHRFEIHLLGKEKVRDVFSASRLETPALSFGGFAMESNPYPFQQPAGQSILKDSVEPTIIDATEFEYTYKCGRCGHVWHELKTSDEQASLPAGAAEELLASPSDGPTKDEEEEDEEADSS
jgi:hypothetical protein